MSKIPTAEEKLKANFYNGSFIEINSGDFEDIKNIMIEFTKLHVEAALNAASENSRVNINGFLQDYDKSCCVDKNSILNAYPLENVK